MKNILLVHGFNGIPKIFDYFKKELILKGYKVVMPNFPVREEITIDKYFEIFNMYKNMFNEDLIVIGHSIGNIMTLKYISKNNLRIGLYISLAGFAEPFHVEGKDVLNDVVKILKLSDEEENKSKSLIKKKYSVYSDNDHIVPFDLLKKYCEVIESKPVFISGIGHMGKKSGIEKLPEILDIINSEISDKV